MLIRTKEALFQEKTLYLPPGQQHHCQPYRVKREDKNLNHMIKSLGQLLIPRQSVFDKSYKDVVLDLTDLAENKLDPDAFFAENYITRGMEQLYTSVFKRLEGSSDDGVFKLTQAMGGGKTHNMIAVGLLAQYPEYRQQVMGDVYATRFKGAAKVVAFSGREKPKYGLWTYIAEQLGRRAVFQELEGDAPGQSDWIRLLQGEPTLILLDELPDYFSYAATVSAGIGSLADKTARALTTLLNAIGKAELSNVVLVISDLQGAYRKGSDQIEQVLGDFEKETRRVAKNFTPVQQNTNEIYHILRKRLFIEEAPEEAVVLTAKAYGEALDRAAKMELTNESPQKMEAAIRDSYPFHPAMRDLYARFKENSGFMQTRGLIRLMRAIVARMFDPKAGWAATSYLIHPYDIDPNDADVNTELNGINSKLVNAISNDIASGGQAAAEKLAEELQSTLPLKAAKLIFMSSLSTVQSATKGLRLNEIFANLAAPDEDISQLNSKILPELRERSWYLHADKNGALLYKDIQNVSAKISSYRRGYNAEAIRKELRELLKKLFEPHHKDLYQKVFVLPALDEIEVDKNQLSLVIFQPYASGGVHPDLADFYDQLRYKNRLLLLTGDHQSMDAIFENARSIRAAMDVKKEFEQEKTSSSDPQYQEIEELLDNYRFRFYSATTNVFTKLFFPTKRGLTDTNINLTYRKNHYDGEEQIRQTLLEKRKFTTEISTESFLKQLELKLFGKQKEKPWNEVLESAATDTSWPWHKTNALTQVRDEQLQKDHWREEGNWIKIGPFPKPPSDVRVQEVGRDDKSGKIRLKIKPIRGKVVHYNYGKQVSANDPVWDTVQEMATDELYVSFLCVDPDGEHATGEPFHWQNTIELKYDFSQQGDEFQVQLQVFPHNADILYSVNGSDPAKYGATYSAPFFAPPSSKILAVAQKDDLVSKPLEFDLPKLDEKAKREINPVTLLIYKRRLEYGTTAETYELINQLKRFEASAYGPEINIDGERWLALQADPRLKYPAELLEDTANFLRDRLLREGELHIKLHQLEFPTGQLFLDFAKETKLDFKPQDIEQSR